jgi:hypothetical protein
VEGLSGRAEEDWMGVGWMFVSPGAVTDDDRVAHGSSRRRVRRREHQHRVYQGRDLRCLRHHLRCRRLFVICTKVVDCKTALERKAAEQDLQDWVHAETCQFVKKMTWRKEIGRLRSEQ